MTTILLILAALLVGAIAVPTAGEAAGSGWWGKGFLAWRQEEES